MKYMQLRIDLNRDPVFAARRRMGIRILGLHRSAANVTYRGKPKSGMSRRWASIGEYFDIIPYRWSSQPFIDSYSFRIPCEFTREPLVAENGFIELNQNNFVERSFANEDMLNKIFSVMVESLYYWDRRCNRSVNISPKIKEDKPIELLLGEENLSLGLDDMLEFAKYIKG